MPNNKAITTESMCQPDEAAENNLLSMLISCVNIMWHQTIHNAVNGTRCVIVLHVYVLQGRGTSNSSSNDTVFHRSKREDLIRKISTVAYVHQLLRKFCTSELLK